MAGACGGRLAAGSRRAPRAARARGGRPAQDRDRSVTAILGIDTSTSATSVAVLVPAGREVERRDDPAPGERPRHAEVLLTLIEQALVQAEVGWEDVERICVGIGPGGFTGLRLGVSTARAPAQGPHLPIVGVSSLEALGWGIELSGENEIDLPGHPDVHGPVLAVI